MDGRRVIEGRREEETDGRRCGECGAGDPGWTWAAQLAMLANALERGVGGGGGE